MEREYTRKRKSFNPSTERHALSSSRSKETQIHSKINVQRIFLLQSMSWMPKNTTRKYWSAIRPIIRPRRNKRSDRSDFEEPPVAVRLVIVRKVCGSPTCCPSLKHVVNPLCNQDVNGQVHLACWLMLAIRNQPHLAYRLMEANKSRSGGAVNTFF